MKFLWDTNILLNRLRHTDKFAEMNRIHQFLSSKNQVFLSVISIGEIESIAYQNNWGAAKWTQLQEMIEGTSQVEIFEETIHAYAKIDAFSQGKLAGKPLPKGISARNMGKNDLWLAATAHIGQFKFATTDLDFNHLHGTFIDLIQV